MFRRDAQKRNETILAYAAYAKYDTWLRDQRACRSATSRERRNGFADTAVRPCDRPRPRRDRRRRRLSDRTAAERRKARQVNNGGVRCAQRGEGES